VAVANGACQAL
jgi:hypothetical protein